ncbi:MAG TPA: HlyD family efflux transporter periplasmic adaptor subunit, partial [Gammaproteobacteria bacterium]
MINPGKTTPPPVNIQSLRSSGMDRPLEKKRLSRKLLAMMGTGLMLLVVGYLFTGNVFMGRTLQVAKDRLSIAKVTGGTFEDFIPLRARVAPLKTVYLDAVQGGRVEEILVEDGAKVAVGQPIVKLSNSDLQLSVMSTESRVMEQLIAMRDQELRLEQNRLNHKRTLVELDYDIGRLTREAARREKLVAQALLPRSEYDDLLDELDYLRKRRSVTLESRQSDEKLMAEQMGFFKEKAISMEENLALARKSLEDLTVRAPVAGRLSGFDMEIGQNVSRGERIGQVSDPASFKLEADIDEYYLGRVEPDQQAGFEHGVDHYRLRIAKIYPNVQNGRFQVDLKFVDDAPSDLRRGQTIQAKLVLGDSNQALLVPNGQFFQDTGGSWIFVLNSEGTEAYKRKIRLGRRNNR